MKKYNLVLGIAHNFSSLEDKFVKSFKSFELKGTNFNLPSSKDFIYHSNYAVTLDNIAEKLNFEKANYKKFPKLRRFSFDIGPCYNIVRTEKMKYFPVKKSNFLTKEKIFRLITKQIKNLNIFFDNKCELAVENLPYYNTPAYKGVCFPEFYNEVSKKFLLNQVLDLAHLEITALNNNLHVEELLERVDHKYVTEIQICKIKLDKKKKFPAIDAHLSPNKHDFDLLMKALKMNPNKKIDIVIEQWKNTVSLQNSYYKLQDFLSKHI